MNRLQYRELVEQLSKIDEWLRAKGLDQHDRIRIHIRNVTEMADALDSGNLPEVTGKISDEKRREMLWSFVESMEFSDAINALWKSRTELPREMLELALQGPADAFAEDDRSNRGRNAMFELAIAGRAAMAGLNPRVGGEPDVYFEFQGRRMFIQCKRLLSEAALPKRTNEAGKQLTRDLKRSLDPRDCGLMALSVSRVFNRGDKILAAHTEGDLRTLLNRSIDQLIQRHERDFRSIKHPKIAGILFHLSTPAFVEEYELYTFAQSATLYHIPGKPDRQLLLSLTRTIKI